MRKGVKRLGTAVMLLCLLVQFALLPQPVQAATAEISSVEVTQVMGKGIDLASGEYYFMNMFVAEKPTSVQVVLTDEVTVDSGSMRLDIYYEGGAQPLATVRPVNSGKQQIVDFIPGRDDVNGWQPGRYRFVATINGQQKTTEAIFNASKSYSVLFVAGAVNFGGQVYDAPDINADTVPLRAQIMPVSEGKFLRRYRKAGIHFGTGPNGYDISTPEGQAMLLNDIEQYRHKSAGGYDTVVVLVSAPLHATQNITGYTNSNHAVVVSLNGNPSASDLEATVAHEIGHIFSNGDEYENGSFRLNINGAPYGVQGQENGQAVSGQRPYLEGASGNSYSGILLHQVQNAYNPKTAAPVLNVSSFMGSSYSHWPTSMVWEQMYKRLVPNYENVLPRVYTDGKVVAGRPTLNDLGEQELDDLKAQFRGMLNEVRQQAGMAPYPEDAILAAGDKHLQKLAEETLAQGIIGELVDLEPANAGMFAELGMRCEVVQCDAALYPYESDELEYMRGFYSQSPCGQAALGEDYFFLAFVRANNITYYIRSSYSGFYTAPATAEPLAPQPETPPVLETNPVTDLPMNDGDYARPTPFTPVDGGDDSSSSSASTPAPAPGSADFAALSREEMIRRLVADQFDLGYIQSNQGDYTYSQLMEFYSWYTKDCYGVDVSAAEVEQALSDAQRAATEAWDGVGERDFGLAYEHICHAFGLYPPQEMRENSLYSAYQVYAPADFGANPLRSKYDKDEIRNDNPQNPDDEDVVDPDGGW